MLLCLTFAVLCLSVANLAASFFLVRRTLRIEAAVTDRHKQQEVSDEIDALSALNQRLDQLQSMKFSRMNLSRSTINEKGRLR